MAKQQKQQYRAHNGNLQWRPSIALTMLLNEDGAGFCLACGHEQAGIEPDVCRDTCEHCGAEKVYGAEELALMGLTY